MRTPDDVYDEWLVVRCQSGDELALGELIERFQARLLRHAARLTGEADAAGDVVQEAWMAILRGLPRLDDPACFRRWAYQIVTHKCADANRARQRPLDPRDRPGAIAARRHRQVALAPCTVGTQTTFKKERIMNDALKDIDAQIREALAKEDEALLAHYGGEPSLHEMMIDSFRGRQRWLVVLAFLWTFVALGALVLCGYQFFQTESMQGMIGWATGFLWGLIYIAMVKIWYWGELSKNYLAREIKRLELQVAHLSRRLAEK